MTKILGKSLAVPAMLAGAMVLLVAFAVIWTARANPMQRGNGEALVAVGKPAPTVQNSAALWPGPLAAQPTFSMPAIKPATTVTSVPAGSAVLDQRRQYALGAIETANDDRAIGRAGEVSRYQIMPSVWRHYSGSSYYRNPEVSRTVAQQHWSSLYSSFKQQARREPNDFDMYVLWNTRYGYYASKGFNPVRLHPAVRDRAERFVNLIEAGDSRIAAVPATR